MADARLEDCSGWDSAWVAARTKAHLLIRAELVARLGLTVESGIADYIAQRLVGGYLFSGAKVRPRG